MKKQNVVFLILLSAIAFASCDKYLGGSSNLTGTWDIYSLTQKTYTDGILDTSSVQNDMGTFTFNSAGDGNYSVKNGDETQSGSFDWFEQNEKVFLNLRNLSDSIMTKNFAIGFDVITNSATQQVWSMTFSFYQKEENPASGYTVNYLKKTYMEMDLRKQ
jgi:hypothetical protein